MQRDSPECLEKTQINLQFMPRKPQKMNISAGEIFVSIIVLVGIGVMVRVVRLRAALLIVGAVVLAHHLLPLAGQYAQTLPLWLFVIIVLVLGISLLRGIVSILFGRAAAASFVGGFLNNLLSPIFRGIGGILRTIFRMR